MNTFGITILWCMIQVTALTSVAAVVYAFIRSDGPVAARRMLTSALVLVMLLSLLAASPWPNWNSWLQSEGVVISGMSPSGEDAGLSSARTDSGTLDSSRRGASQQTASATDVALIGGESFWHVLQSEFRAISLSGQEDATTTRRWPAILTAAVGVASAVALLRVLVGILAGRRLVRSARLIDDPNLLSIRDETSEALGLAVRVPVYETTELGTAAAIGMRRPAVLLPAGWRKWSSGQTRTVIAHELSHLASGDYWRWTLAQLVTAAHIYHPLVHWLARRLRVEQELAADAAAARVSGGRSVYLEGLAEVLLMQHPAQRAVWSMPSFLDSRTPLLTRLSALKSPESTRNGRGIVAGGGVAVLLAVAVVTAGFRSATHAAGPLSEAAVGPAAHQIAAEDPAAHNWAGTFVDPEAMFAVAIRPAAILAGPDMQEVRALLAEIFGLAQNSVRLPAEQMDRLLVTSQGTGPGTRTVIQMQQPLDLDTLEVPWIRNPATTEYKQVTIHHAREERDRGHAFLMHDERTIVLDRFDRLQQFVDSQQDDGDPPAWLKPDLQPAGGQIYVGVNMPALKRVFAQNGRGLAGNPALQMVQPAMRKVETAVASLTVVPKIDAKLAFDCDSPEGAEVVAKTVSAMFTLGGNLLEQQIVVSAASEDESLRKMGHLLEQLRDLTSNVESSTDGARVEFASNSDLDTRAMIALVLPAVHAARGAAYRTQSMNNLKQIALAMHNYEAAHGHLPPPVLRDEESGTSYSWRVALLPYLEQAGAERLYERYRRAEPWDSDHNRALIKEIPVVYRHPKADQDSVLAAYFLLTGEATTFPDTGEGPEFRTITDGLSKTIMAVEARRDIPWTQPVDIAYDPKQPLPQLGGYHVAGYNAVFVDGSVQFIAESIDPDTLRSLLEARDGRWFRF